MELFTMDVVETYNKLASVPGAYGTFYYGCC